MNAVFWSSGHEETHAALKRLLRIELALKSESQVKLGKVR